MTKRTLRPMSLTGLFDEAFDLYKRNFLLFVGICAVTNVPYSILTYAIPKKSGAWFLVDMVAWLLISALSGAALVRAVSACYLERKPSFAESYRAILPIIGPLVLTTAMTIALVVAGLVLCTIPGIVFLFWIAFVHRVAVLEQTMYVPAIKRSRALAAGQWGRILAVTLLVTVATSVVLYAVIVPTDLIFYGSYKFSRMPKDVIPILARSIPALVTAPAYSIVFTLLYYDIRIRKEGFDIEVLARNMAGETVAPKKSKVKA